jgi:hypothetical protein
VDTLLTIEAMNERRGERAGVYHIDPGRPVDTSAVGAV